MESEGIELCHKQSTITFFTLTNSLLGSLEVGDILERTIEAANSSFRACYRKSTGKTVTNLAI